MNPDSPFDYVMNNTPMSQAEFLHQIGWNPMETAPRDGTPFWGRVNEDAIRMFWHPEFNAFVSSFRRMQLHNGNTFADTGKDYSDHSPQIHYPTSWMYVITRNNYAEETKT
jgi:hypothetical protein